MVIPNRSMSGCSSSSLKIPSKDAVARSAKEMDKVVEDLEVRTYSFKNYGKNFPKQLKLSPDSFIQMAFQLAYYRLYNKVLPTYETATLRLFAEGQQYPRIFDCQCKIEEYVRSYAIDRSMDTEKYQLFRRLLNIIKILLKIVWQTKEWTDIFWPGGSHQNFIQMCFGPSDPDCYGICYNPQETELHFTVTAFNQEPTTSAKRFVAELGNTFNDLERLCGRFIDTKPQIQIND
ncbi:unnamed protein product, partial [Mesorhabditis spiculigera]